MKLRTLGTLVTISSLAFMASCGKKSGGSDAPGNIDYTGTDANGKPLYYAIDPKPLEDIDARIKSELGITATWSASITIADKLENSVDRKSIADVAALLKDRKFKASDSVQLSLSVRNGANDKEVLATNVRDIVKDDSHLLKIYDGACKDVTPALYQMGQSERDAQGLSWVRAQICDFKNIFLRPNVQITAQAKSYSKRTKSYECSVVNDAEIGSNYSFLDPNMTVYCQYGYKKLPNEVAPELSYRAEEAITANSQRKPYLGLYFSMNLSGGHGIEPESSIFFYDIAEDLKSCHTINVNGAMDQGTDDSSYRITMKLDGDKWRLTPYVPVETIVKFRDAMGRQPFTVNILCDWYQNAEDTAVQISTR